MECSPVRVIGTPKRVVLGSVNSQDNGSPISPMANLKLLTKVATSHVSFNENSDEYILVSPIKKRPTKCSRQLRSLSYICKRFLELYDLHIPQGRHKQLSLGQLTVLLDIEKRRVYDIINIVASLRFAAKICKDKYSWYGDQFLIPTLCELKAYALKKKYHELIQKSLNNNVANEFLKESNEAGFLQDENLAETKDETLFDDNRIGALCQKCMMLFLVTPKGEVLNFKIISSIIVPKNVQDKAGMRRLYDISNVLETLGLITRCDSRHLKRPSFIYSGPVLPSYWNTPATFPETTLLPQLESYSDSSSDCPESKFQDILEVVCTEMNEMENSEVSVVQKECAITSAPAMSAKKKLFSELVREKPYERGFIKAPQSSFRFTSDGIVKMEHPQARMNKSEQLKAPVLSVPRFEPIKIGNVDSVITNQNRSIIKINEIAKPSCLFKFSLPPIQNGSIYKAVRQGNIIHLVKL